MGNKIDIRWRIDEYGLPNSDGNLWGYRAFEVNGEFGWDFYAEKSNGRGSQDDHLVLNKRWRGKEEGDEFGREPLDGRGELAVEIADERLYKFALSLARSSAGDSSLVIDETRHADDNDRKGRSRSA